jgi:hypothetical protein
MPFFKDAINCISSGKKKEHKKREATMLMNIFDQKIFLVDSIIAVPSIKSYEIKPLN